MTKRTASSFHFMGGESLQGLLLLVSRSVNTPQRAWDICSAFFDEDDYSVTGVKKN